jgi:polar amino acid transport system substrate-binding protein
MLLLVLLGIVAGCGGNAAAPEFADTLKKITERGELVVGLELGFEPFEGVDEQGNYVGFDIDLAREYARELEVDCRFEPMEWTALQTALSTGQIDIIWSGMTATVPRTKDRLFSDTYFRTQLYLLVRADSGIRSAKDMTGKSIAVKMGTTGESAAQLLFPNCKRVTFDDESLCATEVVAGRADAFLYDRFSIERHHKSNLNTTRIVRDVESFEPYAVAMRPGDLALWRSLNLFLERIRWDGRYAAIHKKHFGTLPDERR